MNTCWRWSEVYPSAVHPVLVFREQSGVFTAGGDTLHRSVTPLFRDARQEGNAVGIGRPHESCHSGVLMCDPLRFAAGGLHDE